MAHDTKQAGPDLIIRGGSVIDGTGAPAFEADVAIHNGVICEIGQISGKGKREIDARNKLVTPGFVDIHTHYDAQAIWDDHLAPSSLHGVTTVVMGNCGVGFAPCRPDDREKLIELMEGVEDIPGAVMHEGLDWSWESFPEYLDALERKPRDVDVCALLPHSAVRVNVMGDRAVAFEPATADDIKQMRAITREAVEAGAFGVSTSRTTSEMNRQAWETEQVNIRPVFPPRAIGVLFGLQASQTPFSGCPTWRQLNTLAHADKLNRLRDPNVRAQILSEDPVADSTFPLIQRMSYEHMFPFQGKNYQPSRDESVVAIAAREGRTAPEVIYDRLIENDGKNFLYMPITNYTDFSLSASEKLLGEKMAIMGLGDGGAHVGFILDAGFPTWLLTHWGREEQKFDTPELVRRLTSDTADAAGLGDRGRLKVGLKGDLNVIDWDRLDFEAPFVIQDMPAGGSRLMQGASGYEYTVVSGEITHQDGSPTGLLPGKLVRGQRSGPDQAPV